MSDDEVFNADITNDDLLKMISQPTSTKKQKQKRTYTPEAQASMKERLAKMREKSIASRTSKKEIKSDEPKKDIIKSNNNDSDNHSLKMIELLQSLNSNISELTTLKKKKKSIPSTPSITPTPTPTPTPTIPTLNPSYQLPSNLYNSIINRY